MRIIFTKKENAKFISHLDLVRCFTRIFSRAEVPVTHTQGFNPHPYMVFSPPLSLGAYSKCEMLDIKTDNNMSADELKARLRAAVPTDIEIVEVYEPTTSFNDITAAEYGFSVSVSDEERADAFFGQEKIEIQKKAKKGEMKTVDIKDGLEIKIKKHSENTVVYKLILPCGNEKNIGINLLCGAFVSYCGEAEPSYTVIRCKFIDKNGNTFR